MYAHTKKIKKKLSHKELFFTVFLESSPAKRLSASRAAYEREHLNNISRGHSTTVTSHEKACIHCASIDTRWV